jgi:transposase
MERTTVAVDLAKTVFQVAVSRRPGKTAETRRLRRSQLPVFFAQFPSSVIVMEACSTSNFWGRKFEEMGHDVVVLPPSQVHPYVRRNKTDSADAKALLEAYRNEAIRPVPLKSIGQQRWPHCTAFVRAGWLNERLASTVYGACSASWAW